MREPKTRNVERIVARIREKMKPWGITTAFLAGQLGVSRQYAWQIVHYRTPLSIEKALAIESIVDAIIVERKHVRTFGDRLKAARISAGMTLKQAAKKIGYSWVGVERWEKDVCRPDQKVLWKLCAVYSPGGRMQARDGDGGYGVREELVQSLRMGTIFSPSSQFGNDLPFDTKTAK